jgi:hypothetical protein
VPGWWKLAAVSASLAPVELVLGVVAFIGGLLAKPLADLSAELVKQLVTRRQAKTDEALAQADAASERCWEAFAVLTNELPKHVQRLWMQGTQEYPERAEVDERMLSMRVLLEANAELLHPDAREPMRRVVDIFAAVEEIESANGAPFAHYDPAFKIVPETARYGRQVLRAQLRREKLPPMPGRVHEYLIAVREADEFWDEDYPESQGVAGVKTARELWLAEHRSEIEKVPRTE